MLPLILMLPSCCPEDPYTNYLKLHLATEPKSLDPALSTDVTTAVIVAQLYDNLIRFEKESELVPGIAREWDISTDGLVYTFHLHDGFRFNNGRSIHAEDVKFSFERILDPQSRSPQTWLFTPLVGAEDYMNGFSNEVEGIRVLDSLTVELRLKTPFAPFLGFLAMPAAAIVAREGVESAGDRFGENPLGSGPWILEEWMHDSHVLLRKNPNYFYGAPIMDGIMVRTIPEVLTAAIEFEAGNIDVMLVPTSEFKYWTHSQQWQPYIHKLDELAFYYMAMNCERPPFDNPRIRQAAVLALDREKIVHRILHNSSTLGVGAIPPGLAGFDPDRDLVPFDPDSARQILIDEGYAEGCEFELWVDQSAGVSQTLEAVQSYLNDVGFICRLVSNDWNMMRDAMRKGKTDAYWGNWYADYADAENFLAPLFHSSTSARRNRYSNPEVDRMIEALQQELDADKRSDMARQVDSILVAEAPYAFMWYPTSYTVVQEWVKDYFVPLMANGNKHLDVSIQRN